MKIKKTRCKDPSGLSMCMQAGEQTAACKADQDAPKYVFTIDENDDDDELCSSDFYRIPELRPYAWTYFKVNQRWCSVMKYLRERRVTDNFGELKESAATIRAAQYLRYPEAPAFLCGTPDFGSCVSYTDCDLARPGGDPSSAEILNSLTDLSQYFKQIDSALGTSSSKIQLRSLDLFRDFIQKKSINKVNNKMIMDLLSVAVM